jgi:CHAT domain-containing protein/Flp pilus assembly protein TadD
MKASIFKRCAMALRVASWTWLCLWAATSVNAQSQPAQTNASDMATALSAQDWGSVLRMATEALERNPEDGDAWLQRGNALGQLGRDGEAVTAFERSSQLIPKQAQVWTSLCWSYIVAGRHTEARGACEKSVALNRTYASVVNLGHMYLLEGDLATARALYRDVLPLLSSEKELTEGPLADFDLFIKRGWHVEAAKRERQWMSESYSILLQVISLLKTAKTELQSGHPKLALPLVQRATESAEQVLGTGHPFLRGMLLVWSRALMEDGQFRQALPYARRALEAADRRNGRDDRRTLESVDHLGEVYMQLGLFADAEPLLLRSLALSEAIDELESSSVRISLNNLALLYMETDRIDQAVPLLVRALAIAEKVDGPIHDRTATSLSNLGLSYLNLGKFEDAKPLLERAIAISEKLTDASGRDLAARMNNIALLYRALGQRDVALSFLTKALATIEKSQGVDQPLTAKAFGNLAGLYVEIGEYDKALPLAQRGQAIYETVWGGGHPDVIFSLSTLGGVYWKSGRLDLALPLFQRSLSISESLFGPDHSSTGMSLQNVATTYLAMGRHRDAIPMFRRALVIAERAGLPEFLWSCQTAFMKLYGRQWPDAPELFQPGLAIWWGKQAVNTLQSVRQGMKGLDRESQKSFLSEHGQIYTNLANLLIAQSRLAEAEQVLARLKEFELTELLRSRAEAPRTELDFVGVERKASEALRVLATRGVKESVELANLSRRVKSGDSLTEAEKARFDALGVAVEAWQIEYERFQASLGAMFKQEGRRGAEQLAAKESTLLQAKVARDPAGAVGLHYSVTDDQVGIIVATPGGVFGRFSQVKREELNRQIAALRQAIVMRRDTSEPARKLWHYLIEPVQADVQAIGAKTLVLVLTDALRYLPFAALEDPSGRYLVQDYALASWATAADVTPQVSKRSWQVSALGLSEARPGFDALTAVPDELRGIVRTKSSPQGIWPGSIALNEQFSLASLNSALTGPSDVLHIASHFDFRPGDENGSRLLMGQGDPLTLRRLAAMDFSGKQLLTLSACDTAKGGGFNENGAEVEGLAASIQGRGRGAQAVLASLWSVADASTPILMRSFYGQRSRSDPPGLAQSLRLAQLSLIEGSANIISALVDQKDMGAFGDAERAASRSNGASIAKPAVVNPAKPYAHPYYWAPFVLMGNWL